MLPVDPDGEIPLAAQAPALMERNKWDVVVYLTDLTHYRDGRPIRYEVCSPDPATVVFVPALGVWRQRARTVRLLAGLVAAVAAGRPPSDDVVPGREISGPAGRLAMLAGMVHSNRPGRMLGALTGCTAFGFASGAFGVFYGSVWQIADALSLARLGAISLVVVAALVAWLIVSNGLWTHSSRPHPPGRAVDNASTVITVCSAVALMHVLLVAGLTGLAFVVVDSGYFASQLGHDVGTSSYVRLGWFAASLGTIAGALGSNFDSEESVREATFSKRWYERRKLFDAYDRDAYDP
ncbi:hypothetical protein L5G28_10365 [Gordonia sp. HY285]|uniref:hypothetical protein n=1 Tax=Gordonia liuliyuniae TaxID=2911517 RepID=UPI001F399574|nr:hypothetical protein [Gordonia liuliyuniae]MCF8610554.1 hypothetical protein [Gordonia liuliyuniae]